MLGCNSIQGGGSYSPGSLIVKELELLTSWITSCGMRTDVAYSNSGTGTLGAYKLNQTLLTESTWKHKLIFDSRLFNSNTCPFFSRILCDQAWISDGSCTHPWQYQPSMSSSFIRGDPGGGCHCTTSYKLAPQWFDICGRLFVSAGFCKTGMLF